MAILTPVSAGSRIVLASWEGLRGFMNVMLRAVLTCMSIIAINAHAQVPNQSSDAKTGVVYKCTSANGTVRYTNAASPGCVVIFLYTQHASNEALGAQSAANTAQAHRDDRLIEPGSYTSASGDTVHRPAHTVSGNSPNGATAQCRDGSYSFSENRRGTCSHHGGVAKWL